MRDILNDDAPVVVTKIKVEKLPQAGHFEGTLKMGDSDLTMPAGGILRFDKASGEECVEANYAVIISKNPDALLVDAPATVRETKIKKTNPQAPKGPVLQVQYIDVARAVTVSDVDSFKQIIREVLEDTGYTSRQSDRHVMLRRLIDDDLDSVIMFSHHESENPIDDVLKEHLETAEAAFAKGGVIEVTLVIDLLASHFDDKVIKPADLTLEGHNKPSYARLMLAMTPQYDQDNDQKFMGYRVDYAKNIYNLENNTAYRLKGATKHWSPIMKDLKRPDEQETADDGAVNKGEGEDKDEAADCAA